MLKQKKQVFSVNQNLKTINRCSLKTEPKRQKPAVHCKLNLKNLKTHVHCEPNLKKAKNMCSLGKEWSQDVNHYEWPWPSVTLMRSL